MMERGVLAGGMSLSKSTAEDELKAAGGRLLLLTVNQQEVQSTFMGLPAPCLVKQLGQ